MAPMLASINSRADHQFVDDGGTGQFSNVVNRETMKLMATSNGNNGDGSEWMSIGTGLIASFIFLTLAVITLWNCICCKGEKKSARRDDEYVKGGGVTTPNVSPTLSPGGKLDGSSKLNPEVGSLDSSAAVGLTTARDSSKRQPSIRQSTNTPACKVVCPAPGLPVAVKTPTSSQMAPNTTLQSAPAFTDYVNESPAGAKKG